MTKRIVFLIFTLIFLTSSVLHAKRELRNEDRFSILKLADVHISPDGKWIAYTVESINLKEDTTNTDIYMVAVSGGEPVRLTNHEKADSHPRWSPDNQKLAFLSKRKDKNQVFVMDRNGGEPVQLTDIQQGVEDFEWSPDAKKMALILTDPDPRDKPEQKDKPKTPWPHVITRLQIKIDEIGYLSEFRNHLYTFDLATKQHKQLTSGPHDDAKPRWSPDGKQILFISNRTKDPDANTNMDLFVVSAEGGDITKLTANHGSDENAEWSNDGKWIVFETNLQPDLIYYDTRRLAIIPSSGGEARILTGNLDRNCFQPSFTPDNSAIHFLFEDQGTYTLSRLNLQTLEMKKNIAGEQVVASYTVNPNGTIGIISSRTDMPEEVFVVKDGRTIQATKHHSKLMEEVRFATTERIRFKSKDGTEVEAFIDKPPGFSRSRKYPLVLWIHGGPTSQYQEEFSFQRQLFAAQDYVVVAPNPRGSTGYGEQFCKAIWADWGNKDYEDLMAAVDAVVAQGYIDQKKMAVGGWSYGGILTNYVIVKSKRFAAAISGASEVNYIANYGTDHYQHVWEKELGLPWEKRENYEKISPFNQVTNITTPTLILVGESDWNVPALNSEQLYQSLKRLGRDTMLIVYPGQPHTISKPTYLKDRDERYLAWFAHFLQGAKKKVP